MRAVIYVNGLGILITLLLATKEIGGALPFCEVGEKVSCEAVLASPYSRTLGIPNSVLGFTVYFYLFFLFLMHRDLGKLTVVVYLIISSFSVLASLILFYISYFKIGAVCPYCFASYLINFLNFFISLRLLKVKELQKSELRQVIVPAIPAILVGFGLNWLISSINVSLDEVLVRESQSPISPLTVEFSESIVEFVDPLCPACLIWKQRRASLKDKTKTIYFPLDNECNPAIPREFHKGACFLSKILICAEQLGSLNEVEHALNNLIRDEISNYEEFFRSRFTREYECSKDADLELRRQIQLGLDLKISGTPTVYYKGFLIDFSRTNIENLVGQIIKNESKNK